MWQIWLIIVIILLITVYRYPSSFIFSTFIATSCTLLTSFFIHNLLLELAFLLCFFILSSLVGHFFPHFLYSNPPTTSNTDILLNTIGTVTKYIPGTPLESGAVRLNDETWQAVSSTPISENTPVKVVAIQGVRLTVIPQSIKESPHSSKKLFVHKKR